MHPGYGARRREHPGLQDPPAAARPEAHGAPRPLLGRGVGGPHAEEVGPTLATLSKGARTTAGKTNICSDIFDRKF